MGKINKKGKIMLFSFLIFIVLIIFGISIIQFVRASEGDYTGVSWILNSTNTVANGLTTNGSSIWVTDITDDKVYEYDMSGNYITSFDISLTCPLSRGITHNTTHLWLGCDTNDEVKVFDMLGNNVETLTIPSGNDNPKSITMNQTTIWILDNADDKVYEYNLSLTELASWELTTPNADPNSITSDNNFIWVTDWNDDEVYKYNMNGSYVTSWDTSGQSGASSGIGNNDTYFWIVEGSDDTVYQYELNVPRHPDFHAIDSFSKEEDFTEFTIDLSDNISDNDEDSVLTIEYAINNSKITVAIDNSTDVVTINSVANQSGSTEINLTVWDTDGNQNSTTFDLIINAINDNPWNDGLSNPSNVTEDSGTNDNTITVGTLQTSFRDVEEDQAPTSYQITSETHTEIIDCDLDGSFNIDCTTKANQTGSSIVTVRMGDSDSATTDVTFEVGITPVNDQPFFDAISNIEKDEDFIQFSIDVTANISDVEDLDSVLTIEYLLNDSTLFTVSVVNATDVVEFTSIGNQSGVVNVNLTTWDLGGLQQSTTFDLIVASVNDNPWKEGILSNVTSTEDIGTISVITNVDLLANFSDVEEDGNPTTFEIIEQENTTIKCYFDLDIPGPANILKCDSVANKSGSNNILFSLNDSDGLSIEYDLDVTLTAVNDNPWINGTFDNVTVNEDTGVFIAINNTDLKANFSDVEEDGAPTTYEIISESATSIADCSFVSNDLSCTTVANQSGSSTIKFSLNDSSGLSFEVDFLVTITEVDDEGSITNNQFSPATVYNNVSATVNATITDPDGLDTIWIRANYTGNYVNYTNNTEEGFVNDGNVWSYFIDNGNFTNQDNVSWQYYINDSLGRETIGAIQSFTITNRVPVVINATIFPPTPLDSENLNCTYESYYDYDGNNVIFYYNWYLEGVLQTIDINSQNLSLGNLTTGDNWQCGIVPYDNVENGTEVKSQEVGIGSSNVAPTIIDTNATSGTTNVFSDSTNPTNNNSYVHFEVAITDDGDALDDSFLMWICNSTNIEANGSCTDTIYCSDLDNTTDKVLSCDYTILPTDIEQQITYYAFVDDNVLTSASSSGTFDINHPPTGLSTTLPLNESQQNSEGVSIEYSAIDSDTDTITYFIYISNTTVPPTSWDVGTTGTTYNYTVNDLTTYYWYVEARDSHGYYDDNTSMRWFSVDYTEPNNTLTPTSYTLTSDGKSATITMNQTDGTSLDSCYFKLLNILDSPQTYTKIPCNIDISLDSTNMTFIGNHTVYVIVNDTYGNENEQLVSFVTTQAVAPTVTPVGGGGGGILLSIFGQDCEINEQCASGICDLEENALGRHAITYQTCLAEGGLCGNGICSIEVLDEDGNIIAEKEEFSPCPEDCAAFRFPLEEWGDFPKFIRYSLYTAVVALIILLSSETKVSKKIQQQIKQNKLFKRFGKKRD